MKLRVIFLLWALLLLTGLSASARTGIGIGISPDEQAIKPIPVIQPVKPTPSPKSSPAPSEDEAEAVIMRILLASVRKPLEISSESATKIQTPSGEVVGASVAEGVIKVSPGETGLVADATGERHFESLMFLPVQEDKPLRVNRQGYRGRIRLVAKGGAIRIINIVELDQYLYGVVPREFKTRFPEMARAQAVVARTFAMAHRGRFENEGYDFTSDTRFQVYGGYDSEDPVSCRAVDDTRGEVLEYEGKLVQYSLYHSTCGGCTASNQSVYLTAPIPYLSPVPCRITPGDGLPDLNTQGSESPSATAESMPESGEDFEMTLPREPPSLCSSSGYHRWSAIWTDEQLALDISSFLKDDKIRKVNKITIDKRGPSGRVVEMTVHTDGGVHTLRGNAIRSAMMIRRPDGSISPLYSTRFHIKKEGGFWKALGGGWGHGLGMCQYGALGMTKLGYSYRQILKKYYPGTSLKKYYPGTSLKSYR